MTTRHPSISLDKAFITADKFRLKGLLQGDSSRQRSELDQWHVEHHLRSYLRNGDFGTVLVEVIYLCIHLSIYSFIIYLCMYSFIFVRGMKKVKLFSWLYQQQTKRQVIFINFVDRLEGMLSFWVSSSCRRILSLQPKVKMWKVFFV